MKFDLRYQVYKLIAERMVQASYPYKLMLIGRLSVHWAYVEGTLDVMNETLALLVEPTEPFPVQLKRKLRFYRAAFRHDDLAPHKAKALAIADKIGRLSQRRHDAIHGMLKGPHDENRALRLVRHSYAKGAAWESPKRQAVSFKPDELDKLADEVERVHSELSDLQAVVSDVVLHHFQNLERQLPAA